MTQRSMVRRIAALAASALSLAAMLTSCGGNDNKPANQAPAPVISSPAAGATYRAGDVVTFAGSAIDAEDGTLGSSALAWWVDFHHEAHIHPFQLETAGASGMVTIATRGEVSDNVFYRFHLRATDSVGQVVEVTRDLIPQKAQITLTSLPAGLALTLGGQPVTSPTTVTSVVGLERDIGIGATDQTLNGRRYRFASWSDGGAASHTIATPASNTTYTATFTDLGPVVNQAPSVALTAPANGSSGTVGVAITVSATASDSDGTVSKVEFFDGATKIGEDLTSPYSVQWTPATTGAHSLTAVASDNLGTTTTSVARTVTINSAGPDTQPPTVTITAPANFASGLAGTLTFSANATDNVGVTSVEFQVDGVAAGAAQTAAPFSVSVDTTAYASGQHILRVRASDAAGNQSAWTQATVSFGGSRTQPAGFTRNESFITGLSAATQFAQAPDGRLFVSLQGGTMRVVKNGALLPTPFMTLAVDSSGERGLLGVAFHPNFAANNFVYAYYTTASGGTHNRISRFTANGDVVASGSEQVLVDLPALSSATNHNGGAIHFGTDGKLYAGVGENANSANSQNLSTPLGKLLRFNDDGSIPGDNPFCTTQGNLACAVWAYGLRNPFTFAVQPGTGRIHINDVGEATWEEVNLGAAGANYGWPSSEGPSGVAGNITGPLFTYNHGAAAPAGSGPGGFFVGNVIAGGTFYPGAGAFPAPYRGNYFFADSGATFIGMLDLANGAAYSFGKVSGNPVDMLVAGDGALLVLTRSGIVRFSAP